MLSEHILTKAAQDKDRLLRAMNALESGKMKVILTQLTSTALRATVNGYDVLVSDLGNGCTCDDFRYGKGRCCKHGISAILFALRVMDEMHPDPEPGMEQLAA